MVPMAGVAKCERDARPVLADRAESWLRLEFERDAVTGDTILASSRQEPPLKVVRAFALEDKAALVHIHNVSGGVLGGDRLGLAVRVGAGACAQITTTGATRIYRMREQGSAALQVNEVTVEENGLLEYVPDALIPFAAARFSQETSIRLAPGAGVFWWEILAPGREARGEVFEYASLELKTDLFAMGRPIVMERVRLEPRSRNLRSPGRLGTYSTWASFYICCVGIDFGVWLEAERHLRETIASFGREAETLWGVTTLVGHGLVVRCVAKQGRDVLPGLRAIWCVAKQKLFGRTAVPPRKVN